MVTRKTAEARWLRRHATLAEQILWQRVRRHQLGAKFRRQQPLGGYIVDFYCAEARLVIEADGAPHFQLSGERARYEAVREAQLRDMGMTIMRFDNDEIITDPHRVLWRIRNFLRAYLQRTT